MNEIPDTPPASSDGPELIGEMTLYGKKEFTLIYNSYWKQLYVFALSKVGDEAAAEEVVQNVFIDLWQKNQSKRIDNLNAFLYTTVRNKCIDQLRARLVRNRHAALTLATGNEEDSSTEELVAFKELTAALEKSMALLPEKTRTIFRLNRIEGLTAREVALQLDIPERTVEYHIAQALQAMRVYLKDFIIGFLLVQLFLYS